jgi:hypothetical protein
MADCGHLCCEIRSNPYHTHLHAPEVCPGCLGYEPQGNSPSFVRSSAFVDPLHWPPTTFPTSAWPHPRRRPLFPVPELSDVEHMDADLDDVVHRVLRWLAPDAAHLRDGEQLQELVLCAALQVYGEALEDTALEGLELGMWRRVLVGKVLGRLALSVAEG